MKSFKVLLFLVFGCALSNTCFADTSAKDSYIQAYSEYANRNTGLIAQGMVSEGISADEAGKRAQEFIAGAIECHVKYLDEYPISLQNTLYDTIANGGSYPDAESALKVVVAEAQFGNNKELFQKFMEITSASIGCLQNLAP